MSKLFSKLMFVFLGLYACNLYAFNIDEKVYHLNDRLYFPQKDILVLDDDSIWMVFTLEQNKQTWSEWWHNEIPPTIDNRYIADITEWKIDSKIIIHPFSWNDAGLEEVYRGDKKDLATCSFLLENTMIGELVFAQRVTLGKLISLFRDRAKRRYNKGYNKGYDEGYDKGNYVGYHKGEKDWYEKGHYDGDLKGYAEGEIAGYSKGYHEGYKKGVKENKY